MTAQTAQPAFRSWTTRRDEKRRRIVMMNSLYWTRHTPNPTLESVGNSRRVRTCARHVGNRVADFTEIFRPLEEEESDRPC
jgi:hypothetical protein